MNEKGRQTKLLAAIVAIAMIVCAVAVVASPTQAVPTEYNAPVFSGDNAVVVNVTEDVDIDGLEALFDGAATVTENRTNYYNNGVLTVPAKGMIINLSANMGSEETPLDITIDLNGDLRITSSNGSQVWIEAHTSQSSVSSPLIDFNAAETVFEVNGNVTVNLDNDKGAVFDALDGGAVTSAVAVTGGATLNIAHTSSGVSTWIAGDQVSGATMTYLVVTGTENDLATVNFNNVASIQGVCLKATYADINVDARGTGITLKQGSVLTNSTLDSTATYMAVLVKGNVSLVNSSISADNTLATGTQTFAGIEFSVSGTAIGMGENKPSLNVDADSSVTTTSFGFMTENSAGYTTESASASITGAGTVTGDLLGARNLTSTNTMTYNIDGVTLNNSTATGTETSSVAVTIGSTGVSATGEVDLTDATVSGDGKLVATNGSTVTVNEESGKLPDYLITVPGANVNKETITSDNASNEVTVTTSEQLLNYAEVEGMKITIGGTSGSIMNLDRNLIIADGTSIFLPKTAQDIRNANSVGIGEGVEIVKEGTGTVQMKVINQKDSTNNLFQLNLNGEFTIKQGSVWIDDAEFIGENYIITRGGEIRISGDLSGNLTIQVGDLYPASSENMPTVIFEDFTVNAGATLTLAQNTDDVAVTYRTEGDFNLYGSLISDGPVILTVGTSAIESDFTAFAGAVIQQNVTLVNGNHPKSSINLDDSLRTMEISVDVTGHQVYSQMQTVVIITSLDITPYATLEIMGELIVNEGVTLTVQENGKLIVNSAVAKMIVNGEIVVDNKGTILVSDADSVTVTGSITSDGTVTINSDVTIEENGKVTIQNGANSSISVTGGLTIDAGGELEVRGQMTITPDTVGDVAISNYGTITLNGAKIMAGSTINMAADGAVVNIVAFTGAANAKLTITDKGLVLEDVRNSEKDVVVGVPDADDYRFNYPDNNEISFTSIYNDVGIRNITITEVVTSERDDNDVVVYDYGMNIAGSPTVLDDTTSESNIGDEFDDLYTITLNGVDMRVAADTSLTLGTGITLENKKTLNVAGDVYAIS